MKKTIAMLVLVLAAGAALAGRFQHPGIGLNREQLDQLQFTLGGPLARAIWRDDWNLYCEMVEILTANKQGPVGERNGSIREMCRLVTTNEVTGAKVKRLDLEWLKVPSGR